MKIFNKKLDKTPLIQYQLFIFYKLACLQKNFDRRVLSIRVFFCEQAVWADSVFLRMNTITSCDQLFKPIRIGDQSRVNNLIVSIILLTRVHYYATHEIGGGYFAILRA